MELHDWVVTDEKERNHATERGPTTNPASRRRRFLRRKYNYETVPDLPAESPRPRLASSQEADDVESQLPDADDNCSGFNVATDEMAACRNWQTVEREDDESTDTGSGDGGDAASNDAGDADAGRNDANDPDGGK